MTGLRQRNEPIRRVHMLAAIERLPGSRYRCICDCGRERVVSVGHFNTGSIKSCGCHKPHHGHTNGGKKSREYTAWANMIARCHKPRNKRFKDYGAKGILVCDRWRDSFDAFLADMGNCPDGYTIDREDNTQGYAPENCHWATRSENQSNRAVSRVWTLAGIEYRSLKDAALSHGVSESTIRAWCLGRTTAGRYYPPLAMCFARQLYPMAKP